MTARPCVCKQLEKELSLGDALPEAQEPEPLAPLEWKVVEQQEVQPAGKTTPDSSEPDTASTATTTHDASASDAPSQPPPTTEIEQQLEITLPPLDTRPKPRAADYFANAAVQEKLLQVADRIVAQPRKLPRHTKAVDASSASRSKGKHSKRTSNTHQRDSDIRKKSTKVKYSEL